MKEDSPVKIEISHKTVIFIALFIFGLWLLVKISEVILIITLSFILLSALLKPVDWLVSKKLPRALSVAIIYLFMLVIISLVIWLVIPPLVSQTSEFFNKVPEIISSVDNYLVFHKLPVENLSTIISKQLNQFTGDIVSITRRVVSSIILVVTTFVLSFYFLLEWKSIIKFGISPFSASNEKRITTIILKVENGLGKWVRGQLILSLAVGVLTFIGLTVIGIPFSLPLAVIAGIFEILPIIGPLLSAIPAILVGLTISPLMGLAVIAVFVAVQQLENHAIVPVVMSKVVGVQPPIIIISLLIGAKLGGITGAFLAVPIIVVVKILSQELFAEGKQLEEALIEE